MLCTLVVGRLTAQTFNGNLTLSDQAAVDAFAYSEVTGTLRIQGANITNVDALGSLKTVGGVLYIQANPLLTSIDGLSALTNVNNDVQILANGALTNLDGLSSLESVTGSFVMYLNGSLADISGLSSLKYVGGRLHASENMKLEAIGGQIPLGHVGSIELFKNPKLQHLDGLSSLSTISENLFINLHDALTNLDGLRSVVSIGSRVEIINNHQLSQCNCGLYNVLTSGGVTGSVTIGSNASGCNSRAEVEAAGMCVAAPMSVELVDPLDGTMGVSVTPALTWASLAEAEGYQVEVSTDDTFAYVVVRDSTNTDTTLTTNPPLANDTEHFWRVRATNEAGDGPWSATWSFTTVMAAPDAVTLVSPADGAEGVQAMPIFHWDAVTSATTYQLQVGTDSLFSNVVINDLSLTATSDSVSVPLPNDTEMFWRVRASNEGGEGPWSEVFRFTTIIESPDAVTLLSPDNGATEVAAYTTFSWQPLDDAAAYHLQVGGDVGLTSLVIDDSTLTAATFIVSTPLAYSTGYYWRVRAALDDGLGKTTGLLFGPWSETRSFTVAVGTATENEMDIPTAFALHPAYPNPFNPSTTIQYDVPEAADVRLVVFDALGRSVDDLGTRHLAPGTYSLTWDASTHPSGMYFIRMQAGPFTQTRRMILTK